MISRIKNRALRRLVLLLTGPLYLLIGPVYCFVAAGSKAAFEFVVDLTRVWLDVWKK